MKQNARHRVNNAKRWFMQMTDKADKALMRQLKKMEKGDLTTDHKNI